MATSMCNHLAYQFHWSLKNKSTASHVPETVQMNAAMDPEWPASYHNTIQTFQRRCLNSLVKSASIGTFPFRFGKKMLTNVVVLVLVALILINVVVLVLVVLMLVSVGCCS